MIARQCSKRLPYRALPHGTTLMGKILPTMKVIRIPRITLLGKNSLFLGAVLLLGAFLSDGCTQYNEFTDIGHSSEAVNFTATINSASAGTTSTRTTGGGNQWSADDQVGIFMLATGGNITTSGDLLADNAQYTATLVSTVSEATFVPVSENGTIYYPQSGNVDFVAYYPFTYNTGTAAGQISSDYHYNISVARQTSETEQYALDVLYAKANNNGTGYPKSSGTPVNLAFAHVLAKVTFNVTLGEEFDGLSDNDVTEVRFTGMPVTATLALQDGSLTASAASTQPLTALKAATTTGSSITTFSALFVPQPTANAYTGRTAVFTVDGVDYTWIIPDGETFTAANHYTYPVTVKRTGIVVGEPSINSWTVSENGTAAAKEIGNGIDIVRIPAAGKSFLMGSSDGSNYPNGTQGVDRNATPAEPNRYTNETQHWVTLTKDFYMSKYEITNTQFAAFLNASGIPLNNNYAREEVEGHGLQYLVFINEIGVFYDNGVWKAQTGYESHPAVNVTWYGAKAYADWIGGSIPTEAQWEYACRGGLENIPFGIGTGYEMNNTLANFNWGSSWSWNGSSTYATITNTGNSPNTTQAVGSYPYPNGYGLYDMHGNVREWCADWFSDEYGSAVAADAATDPTGPDTGINRVMRGGGYVDYAYQCRSAYRGSGSGSSALDYLGFRIVFVP